MTEKKLIQFTCPVCKNDHLILARYPATVAIEHFAGLDPETGELVSTRPMPDGTAEFYIDGEYDEYFQCKCCGYVPQRVCGEDDEEGEAGEIVDITSEEGMIEWLKSRGSEEQNYKPLPLPENR